MQEITVAHNRKKNNIEGSRQPDGWPQMVSLAQSCEHLWNEAGRVAAKTLAQRDTDLVILRKALAEGNQLERTKVLYLMSLWDSPEVLIDLCQALQNDPCPVVRHEAAYFLGTTHEHDALEALALSMLKDEDELVRHESAEAIGELGLNDGLPWLERARGDKSPLVRRTVEIAETYIHLNASRVNHNTA